jgi:S-adenosylmethionine synthetase
MRLSIGPTRSPAIRALDVEVVERKGRGHPDTLCDALAEELSRVLCHYYLEQCGAILHHNVDKALLFGGAALPAFRGGRVLAPWRIYLAGRATLKFDGASVPIEALAADATSAWIRGNLRWVDPARHVEVRPLVRAGSVDLRELFARRSASEVPLANDSSIGVGYAPLTPLERIVLDAETALNSGSQRASIPALGEDIKILGVRRGEDIELTVACAFLGGLLRDMAAYLEAKEQVRVAVRELVRAAAPGEVSVAVNVADDPDRGAAYITVTGTSAEAGDDGEAGRGNRANGLITPYRPMTLESAAGKNPVSHVGKLYQYVAQDIAEALVTGIDAAQAAECCLVSRIGHPVDDPQIVDVRLELRDDSPAMSHEREVAAVVSDALARLRTAWREPLRQGGATPMPLFPGA